MAYEYDRYEREDGGGSFLMGLLAGTVLGAGLGMLFAPKAGNELRSQLGESAGRLRSTANDAYHQASDKVSQMVDRGREAYQRARTNEPDPGNIGPSTGSGLGSSTGTSGTMGNTGPSYTGAGTRTT
jgi:hypothetical protein